MLYWTQDAGCQGFLQRERGPHILLIKATRASWDKEDTWEHDKSKVPQNHFIFVTKEVFYSLPWKLCIWKRNTLLQSEWGNRVSETQGFEMSAHCRRIPQKVRKSRMVRWTRISGRLLSKDTQEISQMKGDMIQKKTQQLSTCSF